MDVAERVVVAAVAAVIKDFGSELKESGRTLRPLKTPFPRITHADAVARLHSAGREQDPKAEIRWPEEEFLSAKMDTAFFINNVTDEEAYLTLDIERGSRARVAYMTNQPRTFGVSARVNF